MEEEMAAAKMRAIKWDHIDNTQVVCNNLLDGNFINSTSNQDVLKLKTPFHKKGTFAYFGINMHHIVIEL